jgi:hypothetical protein
LSIIPSKSGEKELHIAFPLFHSAVAVLYVDQSATSQFLEFSGEENILLGPISEWTSAAKTMPFRVVRK